jgi:hypothetical protein
MNVRLYCIPRRHDKLAQQHLFAEIIDVFQPRAIYDPSRDLIRLQGNWYNETWDLRGQHGNLHHVRNLDAACSDQNVHTGEWTPEGGYYAVDDLCDSLGLMALGTRDVLHLGWIHPYSLGHCDRRGADSSDSGA